MILQPVVSSNISAIGYEAKTQVMTVRFNSGQTYSYDGVSEDVYHSVMNARSKGQAFNRFVKDTYQGVQVA